MNNRSLARMLGMIAAAAAMQGAVVETIEARMGIGSPPDDRPLPGAYRPHRPAKTYKPNGNREQERRRKQREKRKPLLTPSQP